LRANQYLPKQQSAFCGITHDYWKKGKKMEA